MSLRRKMLLGASSLVVVGLSPLTEALAQDENEQAQDGDTIVVTAQRKSEQINDVPIAMTALSSDRLAESNVIDSLDLPKLVPGLSLSHDGGSPIIYIRGIGTDITSPGVEPSIATYIDGAYMPSAETVFLDFHDVEQVEVLRGPQGTLFGRNATGGAINITTRGPSDEFEASVKATAGNFDLWRASAFVSGPVLGDSVRGSLSGVYHTRDGNFTDILTNEKRNSQEYYAINGRLQVDLSPNAQFEFYGRYLEQNDDFGTVFTEVSGNSVAAAFMAPVATEPFTTVTDITNSFNEREVVSVGGRFEWDMGGVTLASRTNYVDYRRQRTIDFDLSPLRLVNLDSIYDGDFFTQEILLSSSQPDDKLEWILGGYFMTGKDGFFPPISIGTTLDLNMDMVPDTPASQFIGSISELDVYAVFGDVKYNLTDAWSVAGGLRYSYEEKTLTNRIIFAEDLMGSALGPVLTFPDASADWDSVTWRVLTSYDTGPLLLFAKVETGFIAGAYNTANPIGPGPVDPEEVTAFEVGFKWQSASGGVSLDASVFYNDYSNLHIQVVDAATGVSILDQAEGAESYGADAQMRLVPVENLEFSVGVSYQNSEYTEYESGGVLIPNPPFPGNAAASAVLGGPLDMSGNVRPRSPDWTSNIAANYTVPIARGEIVASGDIFVTSSFFFDPANVIGQSGFATFNARLAYEDKSGVTVSVWGKNLGDKTYLNTALVGSVGIGGIHADQRTYGVTVGVDF